MHFDKHAFEQTKIIAVQEEVTCLYMIQKAAMAQAIESFRNMQLSSSISDKIEEFCSKAESGRFSV
jgi:hypothetical protein